MDIYTDLLNGTTIHQKIKETYICCFDEVETEPLILFKSCNHKYHSKCLSKIPETCLCKQVIQSEIEIPESTGPTYPLESDLIKLEESEIYRPFVKESRKKPDRKINELLSIEKSKILNKLLKLSNKSRKFGYDDLIKNKITIDILISNKCILTFNDLYHIGGATEWMHLKLLGFNKDHLLLGGSYPISALVLYYDVDYWTLKNDLNLSLDYLARNKFTTDEMYILNLDFQLLIDEGLTVKHLKKFEIPIQKWVRGDMKPQKKHFIDDLKITNDDISSLLGWNPRVFKQLLGFVESDETLLYKNSKNSNFK